jgi:hypothetical protein
MHELFLTKGDLEAKHGEERVRILIHCQPVAQHWLWQLKGTIPLLVGAEGNIWSMMFLRLAREH